MRTATVHELKEELQHLPPSKLLDICLRMSKFKKENKELLTYLLFEAHDLPSYLQMVKQEMDESFDAVNTSHVFFAKKTIRKALRIANKHIRYTASGQAETELLIHFCTRLKASGLPIQQHKVLSNIYHTQLKKIEKAMKGLHEDVQYDYRKEIALL